MTSSAAPSPSLWRAAATIAALTAALLTVPLLAMQFSAEVRWGVGDFVAAGALLFTAGMGYSLAARRARNARGKLAVAAIVLLVLGTIWAELAVGLFI